MGRDSFGPDALESYSHFSDGGNPWSAATDTLKGDGIGIQSVLIRQGKGFTNGWVEIETRLADDGGLVLRFLDNEHYYLLAIRDDSAPQPRPIENLEIYERAGPGAGGFMALWATNIEWPRGTSHRIRFDVIGDLFSVYVDGSRVGALRRSAPFEGGSGFGVRDYGATPGWHARFSNFRWGSQ